ncbi:MAG TPA: CHASE2 domain-containing protein [Bryobacteraceae bacterium]|nr:CHASE2 domain-containing protein [Bryobacteraceae bacterium]
MRHAKSHTAALILTFLAIALPFLVNEFVGEATVMDSKFLRPLSREFWYRHLVPGEIHKTRIDEFTIVSIARDVEPGWALGENRCTHRFFMAKLLRKVADADPRLIVIDKWYGKIPENVCAPGTDGTSLLQETVQAISSKVPIVLALGSYTRDEVLQYCPPGKAQELKPEEMVLGDSASLEEGSAPGRVILGLARVNLDIRKIPLGWMVYQDCADVGEKRAKPWPTLAVAAAQVLDPNIMQGNNLTELQKKVTHPYTKLEEEGTFKTVSAIHMLCKNAGPKVNWENCEVTDGQDARREFSHKVVIVGEIWRDLHKLGETVYTGPELQANYIAALLDQSILQPVSKWVTVPLSFVWLAFIFWIFYGWRPELPALALVVSAVLTFGLGWLFSAVITKQFGVFADVIPPTFLEIIGLYLARKIEMALDDHPKPGRAVHNA